MIAAYTLRDVVRLSGLSQGIVLRMVKSRIVSPARGAGRDYLFGFQDVIVLRTARSLYAENISPRRLLASLRRLRASLPAALPVSGVRVFAQGEHVVVRLGATSWDVQSGQLLFDFEAQQAQVGGTVIIDRVPLRGTDAGTEFEKACLLEDDSPEQAMHHYLKAVELQPAMQHAYMNLGCMLHAQRRWSEAEEVYRRGIAACTEPTVLLFNLAVLLEDKGDFSLAIEAYRDALRADPQFADAHFNLARLYAALGDSRLAVRNYNAYRRLENMPDP